MKKANENLWTQERKNKLKTDWLQLDANLCHLFGAILSVILYRILCNKLKQCAMLPRLQIGKIFSICVLVLQLWKNKRIQFCRFQRKWDLSGKKFLVKPVA